MPGDAGENYSPVVNPRDVLTIPVRFEEHTGGYMFHRHMPGMTTTT
jgi:hypothetical protein